MLKIYRGKRLGPNNVSVTVHNKPLWHKIRHSSTGLEWGYIGNGPTDLALSILWDFLGEAPSRPLYIDFRDEFVGGWNDEWEITSAEIRRWIQLRIGAEYEPKTIDLRSHIIRFIENLKREKEFYKMDIRYNLYEKIINKLEALIEETPKTRKEGN